VNERLVIAMVLSDEREVFRQYSVDKPFFGTAPTALLEGLKESRHCEVHLVSCLQQPVRSPSQLAKNIYFHALTVPKIGWLKSGYIGCIRAVRKQLRALKPQVVHGQGTERHCALCAAFSGFPSVITIHGNMRRLAKLAGARPFGFHWCTARLESFVLPRADAFICPSVHTERELSPGARRTRVIPNAVDSSFFSIQPSRPETPTFLCVANILPVKNQIGLMEALDPLAAQQRFRLVFVGAVQAGREYAQKFHRMVDERQWCEYRGVADRGHLKQLLSQATALVLPSMEENCPMAILEAMAAGVLVLASNVGGVPEIVSHGVTGFLFDPTVPRSMAEAVDRVLSQPGPGAMALSQAARTQAQQRFHPATVAAAHIDFYRELAKGMKRGPLLSKS
jgi:glycosyltransferase involved in cell wall biosynthesis